MYQNIKDQIKRYYSKKYKNKDVESNNDSNKERKKLKKIYLHSNEIAGGTSSRK